jgi:hypothetical protein
LARSFLPCGKRVFKKPRKSCGNAAYRSAAPCGTAAAVVVGVAADATGEATGPGCGPVAAGAVPVETVPAGVEPLTPVAPGVVPVCAPNAEAAPGS